ncbi:hypothetical protein WSTR_00460 [Wolbachia endosymbiont of Laodelphax striatellus]|uniref:hypothetical protein n=1 Tax=Wolbachia endosymbiont of Laodelphax striatellus TaxID=368602 RepID=UPI0007C506C5|nr:hypothetical protein [Wolbachia endosymbiont of Laodelphax striatellus]OAB82460.1 hypothetical protein WSTR_00460 [Wolbachia endosymbiont of Laodelphax striatellus]
MNNSIQEKNENPVVTLKAQAEKFDFSKLRADKNNQLAITGKQMYDDFRRMRFVINSKSLDENLIGALIDGVDQNNNFDEVWDRHYKKQEIPGNKKTDQYKEEFERFYNLGKGYTHLLPKKGDKNENYHPIAKEIFKEMFKYAEAQIPSDPLLEELVTNCNQLGYDGNLSFHVDTPALASHNLVTGVLKKTININCTESSYTKIESKMSISVLDPNNTRKYANSQDAAIDTIQSSIKFTLQSQDGKDDVIYKDGKLSLTVPRKLRDYKTDGRSLFDIIKEYFYKFCEKLGFKFEVEIEHDLGDPMSYLEEVALPIHSNEHENTP